MEQRHHSAKGPATDVAHLGTILEIWAHPDDESYLAGGLSIRASANGQRVVCVTATHGEGGGDPTVSRASAASMRDRELAAALAVLGVGEHEQFDYPDGGCEHLDPAAPTDRLAEIIERVRPDTIVTFGPDGVTGHADHRAVSRWATNAWAATGYGARLLYASTLPEFATRYQSAHETIGAFEPGYPIATRRNDLSILLSLDLPTLQRKRTALRAHRSQTAMVEALLGEDTYLRWWSDECFRSSPRALGHRATRRHGRTGRVRTQESSTA